MLRILTYNVHRFVGTDRILKRLSLVRVGDIRLEPANGEAEDLPRIDGNLNVRDALSEIIGSGSTKEITSLIGLRKMKSSIELRK